MHVIHPTEKRAQNFATTSGTVRYYLNDCEAIDFTIVDMVKEV